MTKNQAKRRAPAHLSPETRRWYSQVAADYVLESHHIRLLTLAAEAFDRCQEARTAIASDGMVIPTADGGMKAHPAVAIERDSRLTFARMLRELDLDAEPPATTPRPPALRSNRR